MPEPMPFDSSSRPAPGRRFKSCRLSNRLSAQGGIPCRVSRTGAMSSATVGLGLPPQPSLGRWPGRRFKSCRLSNRHPGAGRNPASCLPRIVAMGSATMGPSRRFSRRLSQGRSKAGRKPGSRPPRHIAILAGSFTASFCRRRQRGGEALPGVARRTPPRVCSGEKPRRLPACPSERRPASRTNISPAHPSGIAFANRTPYAGLERVRTAV